MLMRRVFVFHTSLQSHPFSPAHHSQFFSWFDFIRPVFERGSFRGRPEEPSRKKGNGKMSKRDLLSELWERYSDFVAGMDPVLTMLFLRWSLMMHGMLLCGTFVRFVLARKVKQTLPLQILAVVLGLSFGLLLPVVWIIDEERSLRIAVVSICFLVWLALPKFLPQVLVRRQGAQELTRKLLYSVEGVLFAAQLLLIWRA